MLSFSDTGNLDADATHKPANGAFTVLVNGVANAVTNVSVEAQAKTVTLTLSTAVSHGQTVTVAYADPTTGNDTNAIQDAAGNDAASFAATAVTNNTPAPADTTPPQLITTGDTTRPKVSGDQLVLSFSDTGNLDADATHKPAGGAFTVLVNGVANAVTHVSVEAQAKTVTLTLSTAVTHGQSVTVAYADPTTGNDANAIQDTAGNDAASFAATAVTNNTPAPADTTPPVINTATVTGDQLVLTYTEANTLDAAALAGNAGFTVNNAAGTAAITVSSAVVSATAKTVTLTLSRAVTNTETVTVSYTKPASGAVVQDAAGNDAANFSERAVTNSTPAPPDTQPPTLAATNPITIGDNKLARDESTTVTIRFSEAIAASSFSLADLTAEGSGVTLSNLQTTDGGTTWTVTLAAPTFDDYIAASPTIPNSTNNKISVNLAGITDLAGNAGVGTADSTVSYDIDLQPPFATITLADSTLTVGETTTVTFRFNEVVTNFDASKIDLLNANGTLGPLTAGADGKTWTATFTPTANTNGGADNTIGVKGGVTDVAGNSDRRIFTSAKYSVDTRSGGNTTGPTATIALADVALTAGETTTVTFTFSEAVSGFAADDVVLTDANGTLGPLTAAADGRTWTATFTPTANVNDRANAIRVNLTGVTNTGGYAGVGSASSVNYTVNTGAQDTTPPVLDTATVRGNQLVLRFNDANQLDATLENKPTNEAFTVRVGSAANAVTAVAVDAQAKTVTLTLSTPVAHGQSVTVAYSDPTANDDVRAIQDAAGNDVASFAATAVRNDTPADTTGPTLAATNPITIGDDKLHLGESTTVIIRFSEDIDASSFSIADLTVGGGAQLSNLRSTGGGTTTWEVTLTAPGGIGHIVDLTSVNSSTGNKIRVNLAQITDIAGNAGAGTAVSTISYDIDVVPPGVSITLANNNLTSGATTLVSFSFTEVVRGFDASKIDLSNANGTLGPLTASEDGKTWTATFTPTENVNDVTNNTIRVNMSGVRDLAGNGTLSPVSSAHYTVDTLSAGGVVVPTATITLANTTLKAGETTTVTFRFSETVSGFSSEDIVLTDANGTLGPLTAVGTDRKIWTATFTPTATTEDASNSIGVNMTGVRNAAERAGVGITHSANYSIDTKPPTLAATRPITLRDDKLHLGESTTATIRFSEDIAPDSFSIADLSVEGGARLSNLRRTDGGTTWEVTLTAPESPSVSSTTGNKISVNLAGITDLAGNAGVGTADSTVRYDIDTVLPSVTITLADSSLTVGETTIVTFSFNEAVNGFDASKIDLSNANGTLGPLIASADGKTWTATFTPSANVADTSNTIGVNMSGVRDQAGNSATGTIASANYTVDTRSDTTAPEFSSATVNGNELVLTYTEAGTLDPAALAGNAGFTVNTVAGATAITVNSAVVNATAKTVTLTLSRAVASAETVTVSYTKPTSGAVVQDAAGNDAADFSAKPVTNTTPAPADNTAPEFSGATVNGNELVLTYTEAGTLDPAALAGNAGFTVSSNTGTAITVNSAVVNATVKTVTLTLSRAVASAETVTVSYTKPTSGAVVQDAAGNDAADFSAKPVTNTTPAPADTTAPEFSSAAVNGNELVLTYTEAGTLDPAALAGNAGFTVNTVAGATAITVSSAVVNATVKTVTLTLSRAVASAETVTVSYTKPTSGAVVQDAA
ncbi:hypothetical protein D8B23_19540, partial [Verminephrobacter aporrectodeae subsp. tuberculatae]|uniref:beta strand repeat-containing protein n=1 Tax=Verminephrobacter aporrectodeae TaxID=1110389 RepID=UPI002243B626